MSGGGLVGNDEEKKNLSSHWQNTKTTQTRVVQLLKSILMLTVRNHSINVNRKNMSFLSKKLIKKKDPFWLQVMIHCNIFIPSLHWYNPTPSKFLYITKVIILLRLNYCQNMLILYLIDAVKSSAVLSGSSKINENNYKSKILSRNINWAEKHCSVQTALPSNSLSCYLAWESVKAMLPKALAW